MLPRTYPTVEGARGERRVSVKLLTAPQGQAGIDYIPVAPVQGANPPPESNTDNSSDSGGMLMTTLAYAEGAQEWIDYIPVYIDGPVPSLSVNAADLRPPLEALSWTRATSRCITDYQGNVHEIPASAKPRNGVRVVRNLFASSDTLSTQDVTVVSGATYVISCYGTGSITFTGAATGSLTGTGTSERVATTVVATTTTLTCTVAGSVTSAQCQRARPGQTGPDEYVSNGVLATPYHDGIGVDGLRYFNTDENGALITGTRGYDREVTYGDELVSSDLADWIAGGAFGNFNSLSRSGQTLTVSATPTSAYSKHFACSAGTLYRARIETSSITGTFQAMATYSTDGVSYAGEVSGSRTLVNGVAQFDFVAPAGATVISFSIKTDDTIGSGSTVTLVSASVRQIVSDAWVVSSDVDPIVPSIPVGVAQTNRISYPSDLSNAAWTKLGSATATAGYDAQIGTYTRVAGLAAAGANDVSITASGFTNDSRIEVALLLRAVTTSGLFRVRHPSSTANGSWDIDLAQVSTTRFERIDRFHPAVTINTEFTATAAGAGGVLLARGDSGSGYSVDVARVAQVQGERVHEIPVEATAVSTINADAPTFAWSTNYATNNAGTAMLDFTPRAQTAIDAYYTYQPFWFYKTAGDLRIYQYDGTTSLNFGNQTEGTRTRVATSWETGVGRNGYRDGVSKFAAEPYDGAWQTSTLTLAGPMLLHELSLYPTALTAAQLQALSNG